MRNSTTMLRRDIRHAVRYPMVSLSGVRVPVLFLLLFAGVFGYTLRTGLGALDVTGLSKLHSFLTRCRAGSATGLPGGSRTEAVPVNT